MEQQNVNDIKQFYFQTNENEYILPASATKRFLARLLDLIIYSLASSIIMLIASQVAFNIKAPSFMLAIPGAYDPLFMCAAVATMVTAIGLGIVFPIMNKKNPGQTLGKKALGITVIFFNKKENNVRDIILRELPIIGLLVISNLAILISGYNFLTFSSFYNIYHLNLDDSFASISVWTFIKNSTGADYLAAANYQRAFGYIQVIISYVYLVFLFVIFLTIAFNRKKVGLHDAYAKTSVVDLATITELKEEQQLDETKLQPIDESSIIDLPLQDNAQNEQSLNIDVDASIEPKKVDSPKSDSTEIDLVIKTNHSLEPEKENEELFSDSKSLKPSDSDIKNSEK